MIKTIKVTNHVGNSLVLSMTNPELNGLAITEIKGLGPAKANINTTEIATIDGASYNSARVGGRNIVFSLRFLGSPSIEDSRLLTYEFFPIKKPITLEFETDNRHCTIDGYVEANEPDIFSQNSGCQISIICPNPFFLSMDYTYTRFAGVEPKFEFAFENEGLDPAIEMGDIIVQPYATIDYIGDMDTGLFIAIHATGEVRNLTMYNVGTREVMSIDTDMLETLTGDPIIEGDTINICTMKGYKSATLLREGVMYNIMNCINRDADWFELTKGPNTFAYAVEYGPLNFAFDITNYVLYEGI